MSALEDEEEKHSQGIRATTDVENNMDTGAVGPDGWMTFATRVSGRVSFGR